MKISMVPADIESLYPTLGRRIHELRVNRRLSQEEVGKALQLTRATVANIESGKQRVLVHTLVAIAGILGVGIGELLLAQEQGRLQSPNPRRAPRPVGIEEQLQQKLNVTADQASEIVRQIDLSG